MRFPCLVASLFAATAATADSPYCDLPQSEWETISYADLIGEWSVAFIIGMVMTEAGPFPEFEREDWPATIYVEDSALKMFYRDNIHDLALATDENFNFDDLQSFGPFPNDEEGDLLTYLENISNDFFGMQSGCTDIADLPQFTVTGKVQEHPWDNDLRIYLKMIEPGLIAGFEHFETRNGDAVFDNVAVILMSGEE
ncbi:hypothetical protein [Yoonia sp. 208BN28-4]|uniref:hypothetical protein n=1 Tax=Yoonia sp. 208BN28-4 TaxID=3126505 RepID=UPI00309B0527